MGTAPVAPSASPADSGSFVTVLGRDTVALENYRRSPSRLEGEFVLRVPSTVRFRYVVDLRGSVVTRSQLQLEPASAGGPPARKVTIDFKDDSARITVDSADDRVTVTRAAPHGTIPMLTTGFGPELGLYVPIGMYELAVEQLGRSDSVSVPIISPFSGRTGTRVVVRRSATLVDVDYFRIAWTHVTLDPEMAGGVQGVDMSETTEKTVSRRTSLIDIGAAVKDFAARDARGQGIGRASPPDSARLTVGGASIAIDYSSPRLRGRKVLGSAVPYDKVWRTGANAATLLRTDREIALGGTRIPAGTYTLWTLPRADAVELIVNTQHGQWGTEYKRELDYAHVSMTVTRAGTPRENFAIVLAAKGSDAELRIEWDDFVWSVPVVAR